jgi:hypothetical protein
MQITSARLSSCTATTCVFVSIYDRHKNVHSQEKKGELLYDAVTPNADELAHSTQTTKKLGIHNINLCKTQ